MAATSPIIATCTAEFCKTKLTAEQVFAQLADEQFHIRINAQQNSIAVIIQHLAGNMLSRWTNFLTTDGEKPGRDRDDEFVEHRYSRAKLMDLWNSGWAALFSALESLTDADLQRGVTIRNEPHTVFHAINRQTAHYNLHLGQILLIGKHLCGECWNYLSIPPGGSAAFNRQKGMSA